MSKLKLRPTSVSSNPNLGNFAQYQPFNLLKRNNSNNIPQINSVTNVNYKNNNLNDSEVINSTYGFRKEESKTSVKFDLSKFKAGGGNNNTSNNNFSSIQSDNNSLLISNNQSPYHFNRIPNNNISSISNRNLSNVQDTDREKESISNIFQTNELKAKQINNRNLSKFTDINEVDKRDETISDKKHKTTGNFPKNNNFEKNLAISQRLHIEFVKYIINLFRLHLKKTNSKNLKKTLNDLNLNSELIKPVSSNKTSKNFTEMSKLSDTNYRNLNNSII